MENGSGNPSSINEIETNPLTSPARRRSVHRAVNWPTVDGPLGLSPEDSLPYARWFFKLGFLCLPFLWAVNCFYFWPVLRHPNSHRSLDPLLRRCKFFNMHFHFTMYYSVIIVFWRCFGCVFCSMLEYLLLKKLLSWLRFQSFDLCG